MKRNKKPGGHWSFCGKKKKKLVLRAEVLTIYINKESYIGELVL
jgi:hypothetical protein